MFTEGSQCSSTLSGAVEVKKNKTVASNPIVREIKIKDADQQDRSKGAFDALYLKDKGL